MQTRRAIRPILAGICLGSLGLWLAFRGVDFAQLRAAFRRVDYGLSAAALLTTIATLGLGAFRWQILFYPDHRRLPFATLFRANVIGQMLNIVVPIRVGEIARIYAVGDRVSKPRVLATLAVEKTMDLAAFALALIVVLAAVALPPDVRLQQRMLWLGGVGGALVLWLLARQGPRFRIVVSWLVSRLPSAWRPRVECAVSQFIEGLSVFDTSWAWWAAIALTVATVVGAAATNYLLFLAFGWRLPALAALLLLVLLQVGAVPPSLPGKLGIFNYVTVLALAMFSVDRAAALGYSILLYAVAFGPKILLGAVYLALGPRPVDVVHASRLQSSAPAGAKSLR